MREHNWTTNEAEVLEITFMDWVAEACSGNSMPPAIRFFGDTDDVAPAQMEPLKIVMRDLEQRNLIGGQKMLAGWSAFHPRLTAEGQRLVDERRRRRNSRRFRDVAARDSLLDWLYENTDNASGEAPEFDTFAGTTHAHIDGDPFTEHEIQEAATFLGDEEFITGIRAWGSPLIRPKLTAKGKRAVTSGNYTEDTPLVTSGATHSITIEGPNYGPVASGQNVAQTQTVGVDPATFAALVGDLRSTLGVLSESDRASVETYVEMIEAEATSDQPDRGVLVAAGRGLKRLGDKVTTKTVGVGIDLLWSYISSKYDLPSS